MQFSASEEAMAAQRERMVSEQIARRGIREARLLEAMRLVPRHRFVPLEEQAYAYTDGPLPIGEGQTISQPYIVGLMTQMLGLQGSETVLEVGTGSGYQAAVLAQVVSRVYSVEIIEALHLRATERLAGLGYKNVETRLGDGYQGWPEHAPYDGILVTAAARSVPPPLVEQLKPGARLVIPVGEPYFSQRLLLIEKAADGSVSETEVLPVAFVPLTGGH